MEDRLSCAVNDASCHECDIEGFTRVVGVPLTKNSAAHRCALQPAIERCAMPLAMATAISFEVADAHVRWRTTWPTCHSLLRCGGSQQCALREV